MVNNHERLMKMPNNIERALNELAKAVENDTYNLTRDDQEQIAICISQLKQKIESLYKKNLPNAD